MAEKSESSRFWHKEKTTYFVEVKYRRAANQGMGLDCITPTKLKQMQQAAQNWVAYNNWLGQVPASSNQHRR